MAYVELDVPTVEGDTGDVIDCAAIAGAERLLTAVQPDGSSFALLVGWVNDAASLSELRLAPVPPYQAAALPVQGSQAVPLIGVPFRFAAAKRLTGTDAVVATIGGEDASPTPTPANLTDPGVSIVPSAAVNVRAVGFENTAAASIEAAALHLWAAEDIPESDTDYFTISVGWLRLGTFIAAVTVTTQTVASGGIGSITRGTATALPNLAQTMPANSAAAVSVTPTGTPTPAALLVVYPLTAV